MKIKPKYWKMIKDELESPLTYSVKITRNLNEDEAMVITISQTMPVELFSTEEMRKELNDE